MKIVTHNGKFHADDVFAVATLLSLYPDAQVIRTRNQESISDADIVVDVGGEYDTARMRFDHHQLGGATVRENGIPYASFGLVWKEYGERLAGADGARAIEERLVMPIDALDNGVSVSQTLYKDVREYSISDYLYSYWVDESNDEAAIFVVFQTVVNLAKDLLAREINKAKRVEEDTKAVEAIYENTTDKRLIILDKPYSWKRALIKVREPLVVVYPRLENSNWGAQAVRRSPEGFETRVSFPESWAGKSGQELIDVSGVEDAVFCHKARFLVVAKTKEGAVALAEKAINS